MGKLKRCWAKEILIRKERARLSQGGREREGEKEGREGRIEGERKTKETGLEPLGLQR